nr:MAG TPA: hypothetical protein [Caudoviricetes sp.]
MPNKKIIKSNKAIVASYRDAFISKQCTRSQNNDT